jgi:hypothetical protein
VSFHRLIRSHWFRGIRCIRGVRRRRNCSCRFASLKIGVSRSFPETRIADRQNVVIKILVQRSFVFIHTFKLPTVKILPSKLYIKKCRLYLLTYPNLP